MYIPQGPIRTMEVTFPKDSSFPTDGGTISKVHIHVKDRGDTFPQDTAEEWKHISARNKSEERLATSDDQSDIMTIIPLCPLYSRGFVL